MLNFKCLPKPAHLSTAFLSKNLNIPELQKRNSFKINHFPWADPNKTYKALRGEWDTLPEEMRLEKQSKQLDQLYESIRCILPAPVPTKRRRFFLALPLRPKAVPSLRGLYILQQEKGHRQGEKKAPEEFLANKVKGKGEGKDKQRQGQWQGHGQGQEKRQGQDLSLL